MADQPPDKLPDDQEAARNSAEADIGIVAALSMEVSPFVGRCLPVQSYVGDRFHIQGVLLHDIRIAVVEAGAGATLASRATHTLLDGHTPKWVLSVGFSGALQSDLKVGDLVVANAIVDRNGKGLSVPVQMQSSPQDRLFVGKFLNTDHIIRLADEKKQLGESTGAMAVDMESLAVARVCAERNVRFMSVRVISDDLSKDLPPEVLSVFGSTGYRRAGAVLSALWNRPSSWSDMWQLREQAVEAAARLGLFLRNVVERLGDDCR